MAYIENIKLLSIIITIDNENVLEYSVSRKIRKEMNVWN